MLMAMIASARLLIVPVFEPTGVSTITLLGLSRGTPVITSLLGLRSLEDTNSATMPVLCVNFSSDAFLTELHRLYFEPVFWEMMSKRAVAYINKFHSAAA